MLTATSSQKALAADFYEGLRRYHNVDGKGNGGKVEGLMLPPGVSEKQLDGFMHDVADFLSTQPGVTWLEAPPKGPERAEFRKEIAESRRLEVSSHVKQNVAASLDLIASPAIRKAVQVALDAAPREFFEAPSSSSGRFHPADEINPGGLALHTLRDVQVGDMLCRHFEVTGKERDEILAGLLLHDIKKGGDPWKSYAADHGPMASKWLEGVWSSQDNKSLTHVRELVSNHMAQWNDPSPTPPKDLDNLIVSYADYLGSRDNVYVETPKG